MNKTNTATNIQNEEVQILKKKKDELQFKIQNVDKEIKELKDIVKSLAQSKVATAKYLNQCNEEMRSYLIMYTQNLPLNNNKNNNNNNNDTNNDDE